MAFKSLHILRQLWICHQEDYNSGSLHILILRIKTDFKKWVVTVEQVFVGMCPEPKGHTRSLSSGLPHPMSQLHILCFLNILKNVNHFECLYWICCNIACFLWVFFFGRQACGTLGSLTRDWTCISFIERGSLNHWTAREVFMFYFWFTFYEVCVTGPWRTVEKGEFPSVINADNIYGRALINI